MGLKKSHSLQNYWLLIITIFAPMRLKRVISVVLLTVYSIVLAHGFIPHDHHSVFDKTVQTCNHNHNLQETDNVCSLNHNHHKTHNCSFSDITVLTKLINLADLFVPLSETSFLNTETNGEQVTNFYFPLKTYKTLCRNISHRGPPQFS